MTLSGLLIGCAMQQRLTKSILFVMLIGISTSSVSQALPEGNTGIAALHPNDMGIDTNPAVVFFDDFESHISVSSLYNKWNDAWHSSNLRIVSGGNNVFSGSKSIEMALPRQNSEAGNVLAKRFPQGHDTLFVRFYSKFDAAYNVAPGSSHNGATIESNYCCPGVRADGYNKFFISYEAGREGSDPNPGRLNIYIYHPEQRDNWGDHFYPTGRVASFDMTPGEFGASFFPRPDIIPELNKWQAYELMVKANTPGKRDGRIAMWLDGKLIGDFPNLRLRDTNSLKVDKFSIGLHVKSNTLGTTKKLYDNVVAATSYIGPMNTKSSDMQIPPSPPENLRVNE